MVVRLITLVDRLIDPRLRERADLALEVFRDEIARVAMADRTMKKSINEDVDGRIAHGFFLPG